MIPPMVKRFQFKRWSPLRRAIHDMARGQTLYLDASDALSARTHVNRLNDAYCGTRAWKVSRADAATIVKRLA